MPRIVFAICVSLLCFARDGSASDPVDFAARLIGRPYVWGAEGPDAFDCSGLTQYVYQRFGIELPRRAISQSRVGDRVRRMQRGDLLFYSTDTRRSLVTHVGIYEGNGMMIEASKRFGRVRRDRIDGTYWAERFMFARRIASDAATTGASGRPERARSGRRRVPIDILEALAGVLIRRDGR